jgi:hypothetical protein
MTSARDVIHLNQFKRLSGLEHPWSRLRDAVRGFCPHALASHRARIECTNTPQYTVSCWRRNSQLKTAIDYPAVGFLHWRLGSNQVMSLDGFIDD